MLAEQGVWGEAPKPPNPLFALNLFGSGFASLGFVHLKLLFPESYRDWHLAFGQQPMANS